MKKPIIFCLIIILLAAATLPFKTFGQTISKDTSITKMVNEISPSNLESTVWKLVSFGTRHSFSTVTSDKKGIGAARNWVKSEMEKYGKDSEGRLSVALDPFKLEPDGKRISRPITMMNVVATLKGTDPTDERVFLISGHLDSRVTDVLDSTSSAPGANDDASGVAVVMELARIMSKRKFPATVIFMAVSGEEQSLFGSKYMADKMKFEEKELTAMLNNDIVGSSVSGENIRDNTRLRIFSEGGLDGEDKSRQLARYIKEAGEKYVDQFELVLVYRMDRYLRGGDHLPFIQAGYAAVRFSEMNENFDHQHQDVRIINGKQYGDLPEFMDFDYLKKVAGVNLASISSLAKAPYQPENTGVEIKELTNRTTLRWSASSKGKKPVGYMVLMRETSSPVWEKRFYTTENAITLPYSKDNYFFGVVALDESGNSSLPTIPQPIR